MPCDEESKAKIVSRLQEFDVRGESQYQEKYPEVFKVAAVLLPLKLCDGKVFILLTKRAKTLRSHASDAAFPGGMAEKADNSLVSTALREAQEEIGLGPSSVEILAVLNRGITMNKTIVYPVVGLIQNDFQPEVNPSEVEFAFFMPLKDFICEEKVDTNYMNAKFLTYVSRHLTYEEGDRQAHIWGFTSAYCIFLAKIVFNQADYLELFVGSTYTGKISDCFEEYFNLCYKMILSEPSPKL